MKDRRTIRGGWQAAILCCALLSVPVLAQVSSYGDKQTGENAGDQLPQVLQKVGVAQHLNQQLPLDAAFVDETGKPVKLGRLLRQEACDSCAGVLHLPDAVLGGDGRAYEFAGDGEADAGQGFRCGDRQHRSQ